MENCSKRLALSAAIFCACFLILSYILLSYGIPKTILIKTTKNNASILSKQRALQPINTNFEDYSTLPLCPEKPQGLSESVQPEVRWKAYEDDSSVLQHVLPGGSYRPRDCREREHVAIIVPFRDREEHLRKLLIHLHQFLPKQKIGYRIFVAEMTQGTIFNTGMMQNVGFQIADKTDNFTCFVIHDVDLMPTNENNLYKCDKVPLHIATNNSKYKYRNPFPGYFGGVISVTRDMYYKANGFSNLYFGWGGQDDDFRLRLVHVGLRPREVPMHIGVYRALPHDNDPGNPINHGRGPFYRKAVQRMKEEGLNTLQYKLMKLESRDWYTWILVEVNKKQIMAKYEHYQ